MSTWGITKKNREKSKKNYIKKHLDKDAPVLDETPDYGPLQPLYDLYSDFAGHKPEERYRGGLTVPGYPHTGPGNTVSDKEPTNPIDKASWQHDKEYKDSSYYLAPSDADDRWIENTKDNTSVQDYAVRKIGQAVFGTKAKVSPLEKKKDMPSHKRRKDDPSETISPVEDVQMGEPIKTPMESANNGSVGGGLDGNSGVPGHGDNIYGKKTQVWREGNILKVKTCYTYKIYTDNTFPKNTADPIVGIRQLPGQSEATSTGVDVELPWRMLPNNVVVNYFKHTDMMYGYEQHAHSMRITDLNIKLSGLYSLYDYDYAAGKALQNASPSYIRICVPRHTLKNASTAYTTGKDITPTDKTWDQANKGLWLRTGDCHVAAKYKFTGGTGSINKSEITDNSLKPYYHTVNVANSVAPNNLAEAKTWLRNNPALWYPDLDMKEDIELLANGEDWKWNWKNSDNNFYCIRPFPGDSDDPVNQRMFPLSDGKGTLVYALSNQRGARVFNKQLRYTEPNATLDQIIDRNHPDMEHMRPILINVPDFPQDTGGDMNTSNITHKNYFYATYSGTIEFKLLDPGNTYMQYHKNYILNNITTPFGYDEFPQLQNVNIGHSVQNRSNWLYGNRDKYPIRSPTPGVGSWQPNSSPAAPSIVETEAEDKKKDLVKKKTVSLKP